MRASLLLLSLLFVGACGRATFVVQQYTGPARPPESVAVLRVNGNEDLRVVELDDRDISAPLDHDARLHIEMLPARHTLVVASETEERDRPGRRPRLAFNAEPGKVYRVAAPSGTEGAHVYEVDRGSDAVVRDATVVEQPVAPPPPVQPPPVQPPPETPPPSADTPTTP